MSEASRTLILTTPSDTEILLVRRFDAPSRLVFDCWTKPEHLAKWFGPRGWNLADCEVDLQPGGAWRFILRGPDDAAMGMKGNYREIAAPRRLVFTEVHDDSEEFAGPALVSLLFEESAGRTTMTQRVACRSKKARDMHLQRGLEEGAAETLDRLEALLARLQ